MKSKYLLLVLFLLSSTIHSQSNYREKQSNDFVDSLFGVSETYFLENNLDETKKIFTNHLNLFPGDLRTLEYLSQIAIAQQDVFYIKFYNEKILSLDSNNVEALTSLGVINFNEGSFDKAESLFIRTLDIEPNHSSALYNLGILYGTKGDFRNAETTLNKAAQLNPLNSEIYQALGIFYIQNQFYDEAESQLLKAISIDENLLEARKGLIILYQNQNRLDQSSKYIKEMETVSENYPQINLLIAIQKFLEGETDSAITYALKETEQEPDHADAYYFLSKLYSLNGEEINSQKAFGKAEILFNNKSVKSSDEMILKRKSLIDSISK